MTIELERPRGAIAMRGVEVHFGEGKTAVQALDGIDLAIAPGEFLGVVGPSGCGKSTLLELVSGLARPSSGSVRFEGKQLQAEVPDGVGVVFQEDSSMPWLSVRQNVGFGLRTSALPQKEIAERVDHAISFMGLAEFRNSFIRELSTGTRRIVDLACLVAHRPAVILLDEPSSGIAQREVEALAPVVERLRDEMGASLVIIEHDIPFVSGVADRLIALDQGRVVTTGSPSDVLAHPDVIESYLGTSSAAIARSGGTE